jgi:hypothetical protein
MIVDAFAKKSLTGLALPYIPMDLPIAELADGTQHFGISEVRNS